MTTELEKTIKGISKENLLEKVPIEVLVRPKGFYKEIGLDVLAVLSAVWVGYACNVFLQTGAVLDFAISIFPFLIITALETVIIKSLGRRFLILLIEIAILLLFFYRDPMIYIASAGGIFLIFSLWGEVSSRTEIMNSIGVSFLRFSAPIFKKTITGLILFTIIIYVPSWNDENVFISPQAFGGVFVWVTGIAHGFYPEINFNSTVNDLAKEITRYQLTNSPSYKNLPEGVQQSVLNAALPEVTSRLKQVFGENLTGNEEVNFVTYKLILNSLNRWRVDFGTWFIIAWIAVVFLASRSIGALVWWISALIALLIYEILVSINFIAIRGETVTKESLVFP